MTSGGSARSKVPGSEAICRVVHERCMPANERPTGSRTFSSRLRMSHLDWNAEVENSPCLTLFGGKDQPNRERVSGVLWNVRTQYP